MQTKNQTICCQLLTAQTAAVIPPVHRECWSKEAVVQGAVTDLSCSVTRQNLKDPTDNKCTETFRLCSLLYRVCCFMSRGKTELTHSCIKHLGLEEHSLTASEPLFATPPTPDPIFDVSTSTSPSPCPETASVCCVCTWFSVREVYWEGSFGRDAVSGTEAQVEIAPSLLCCFPRVKRKGEHTVDSCMKSSEGSTDILRCYSY